MLMLRKEKSKLGVPKKITSLYNYTKNTPRSGRISQPWWEIETKISAYIDTEDLRNSE